MGPVVFYDATTRKNHLHVTSHQQQRRWVEDWSPREVVKIWKAVKTGELASKTCRVTKAPIEVHPLVDDKLLWNTLKNEDVFLQIEMEAFLLKDSRGNCCVGSNPRFFSDASRRPLLGCQGKIAKRAKVSTSPYQCLQIPRSEERKKFGGREMADWRKVIE